MRNDKHERRSGTVFSQIKRKPRVIISKALDRLQWVAKVRASGSYKYRAVLTGYEAQRREYSNHRSRRLDARSELNIRLLLLIPF